MHEIAAAQVDSCEAGRERCGTSWLPQIHSLLDRGGVSSPESCWCRDTTSAPDDCLDVGERVFLEGDEPADTLFGEPQ
jgi:hypothetical protein